MRKLETWLAGLSAAAIALLLPMATLGRLDCLRAATSGFAAGACDDGSANLAMGCASILL